MFWSRGGGGCRYHVSLLLDQSQLSNNVPRLCDFKALLFLIEALCKHALPIVHVRTVPEVCGHDVKSQLAKMIILEIPLTPRCTKASTGGFLRNWLQIFGGLQNVVRSCSFNVLASCV